MNTTLGETDSESGLIVGQGMAHRGFRIIRAGPQHFSLLARYRFRMFEDIEPGIDHASEQSEYVQAVEDFFRARAEDPGQILLLAVDDSQASSQDQAEAPVAMGCAAMIVSERPPRLGRKYTRYAYVHNVYVLPEFRGRGIAKTLVSELKTIAIAMNVRRISLHASRMGAAVYTALGYTHPETYMELQLPDSCN